MAKYKVGPREVAGVEPGGVLELPEDTNLNVPALIEAGHLTEIKPRKVEKPEKD